MRIAVLGGGPGGLFTAALAKASDPGREVTLFERNRAEDTFGFGVVFSDATLEGIHAADPVLRTALHEHGVHWDPIEVRLHGQTFRCAGNGMAAVERRTLLQLLQQRAIGTGADLRFSTDVDAAELLTAGFDLVVAADGANSRLRERHRDVFEPEADAASAKFIWLGTTYPFEGLTFVHRRSPHGVFAVHGYPIGNGLSTFIVETDEDSWRAAGLDEFDVTRPPGASDEKSRDFLQDLFAPDIAGHPLLTNNSRWGNFRTLRTRRWRHRVGATEVALLGDAAHTAHFSVGSGTKMAMEDAIALVAALDEHGADVGAATEQYESLRQVQVVKIQDAARPSLSWWEHFGRSHDSLPAWQFPYHFLTRSLTDSRLRRRDAAFVDEVTARWVDEHHAEPLHSPIVVAGHTLDDRRVTVGGDAVRMSHGSLPLGADPPTDGSAWALRVPAPPTEAGLPDTLETVAKGVAAGAALVVVEGGTSLTRRLVTEAARLELGTVSVLVEDGPSDRAEDVALTAVLSGRTDLVGRTAEPEDPS